MIDIRAERTVFAGGHGDVIWTEILDGIQVGQVDSSAVRFGTITVVLLNINSHQAHVHGIQILEEKNDARAIRKVCGNAVVFERCKVLRLGVHLLHRLRHDSNRETLRSRYVFYGHAELLRALFAFGGESLLKVLFQKRRHLCLRKLVRWLLRRGTFESDFAISLVQL